jgi:hypothetical protein
MIRSGWEIDNIQISLSDGVTTTISPQFGGNGGDLQDPWVVPKYEHITQVEYRSGDRIDSLTRSGDRLDNLGFILGKT